MKFNYFLANYYPMGYRPFYGGAYMRSAPTLARSRRNIARSLRRKRRRTRRKGKFVHAVQPYSIVRKLKTSLNWSSDTAAGAMGSHILKLNSAYDPTGNGGSGQGLGFEQYEALYNKYCVVGWKVEATFISTDNTVPIAVGFTPTTQSTATGAYLQNKEMPGTVMRIITPDIDRIHLTAKGSVKRWLLPKGGHMLSEDTLQATVSTDPSRQLYGHLFTQCITGADPAAVNVVYTIEQIVIFFDPKVPARSSQ